MQKRKGCFQLVANKYKVIDLGYGEFSSDSFRTLLEDYGRWVASVLGRRVDILHHGHVVAEISWDRSKGARIRISMDDGSAAQ